MAIPAQKTVLPSFAVDNRFPTMPVLKEPQDTAAMQAWWYAVQLVLQRQFNAVSAELDKKANKP